MRVHLALLLLFSSQALGQSVTLSGYIKDASSGEDLIGASLYLSENQVGTSTNVYGYYSLTVSPGNYVVVSDYLGYQTRSDTLSLQEDLRLDITLLPLATQIGEVEVVTTTSGEEKREFGIDKLSMSEIENVPVLFGEKDILNTVQLLPGVKGAGEGSTGFYIRGGGLDQNLILLDEAPIYNPSHLLGFFSVFNSDAIKDVTLYKGAMPAQFGGRVSSVMDIRMKEGNNRDFAVEGGLGLISSKATIQGPIVKEKGSFILSGRRTYADLFLKLSSNEATANTSLYFYDLNGKVNYELGANDRIFLSGYLGRDSFGFNNSFGLDWGNKTATLRWNHLFTDRLFSNTSLIFSDYSYDINFGQDEEAVSLVSFVRDWNLKQDYTWYVNDKNRIQFGFNTIYHRFQSASIEAGEDSGLNNFDAGQRQALESGVYLQNHQSIGQRVQLDYGIRYSMSNLLGPDSIAYLDENGKVISSATFGSGEIIETYSGFEPRISMSYQIDDLSKINLGFNRNLQFVHLLTNSTSGTPTDIWVPCSPNIKPQTGWQTSSGYFRDLPQIHSNFSIEAYYKQMDNLIDYRVGADIFLNESLEGELVYGSGYAYGVEAMLSKKSGRLHGWLSYTYSRTIREFEQIDNGDAFPAKQDRIHDISIVGLFDLNEKITCGATWVFNTGDAVTFPSGKYTIDGQIVPYYTERNGYRMPNYHRLDLGVTWKRKSTSAFQSEWNFSLYNAYGRENAYQITFQPSESDPTLTEAVQLSLFKWVPSVSYNFKF